MSADLPPITEKCEATRKMLDALKDTDWYRNKPTLSTLSYDIQIRPTIKLELCVVSNNTDCLEAFVSWYDGLGNDGQVQWWNEWFNGFKTRGTTIEMRPLFEQQRFATLFFYKGGPEYKIDLYIL